jgi:hypothetical protein
MSTRLLHYSAEPFAGPVHSIPAEKQMVTMKPDGLWVSVEGEDDWPSWCRSEEFALNRLKSVSVIRLRPGASVLWVDSPAGIDRMIRSFGFIAAYGIASA